MRVSVIRPRRCLAGMAGKVRSPAAPRVPPVRVVVALAAAVLAVAVSVVAVALALTVVVVVVDPGHILPPETNKKEPRRRRVGVSSVHRPRPTPGTRWETSCERRRRRSGGKTTTTTTTTTITWPRPPLRPTRARAGGGRGRRAGLGGYTWVTGARGGSIVRAVAWRVLRNPRRRELLTEPKEGAGARPRPQAA